MRVGVWRKIFVARRLPHVAEQMTYLHTATASNVHRVRCHAGGDVWHTDPGCSSWPTTVYAAECDVPTDGMVCPECLERSGKVAA